MTETKPYVSAARYAALLGCPRDVVIEDVKRGMAEGSADAFSISGGWAGDWIVVEAWETAEERLALHRKRLGVGATSSGSEGQS